MSKRLQVVIPDAEFARLHQAARAQGLTTSEWVRQVLRQAERDLPTEDPDRKLAAIRAAVRHEFPTGDIDEMLGDIERGYTQGRA
jgi:hypothetical protein